MVDALMLVEPQVVVVVQLMACPELAISLAVPSGGAKLSSSNLTVKEPLPPVILFVLSTEVFVLSASGAPGTSNVTRFGVLLLELSPICRPSK